MVTRIAFQTAMRAAAVQLLTDYAASVSLGLQVYRARPASIYPPSAFVEGLNETLIDFTSSTRQRVPTVLARIVWGDFDSGTAVDQRDAFVDGFLDWVQDRYHAAGANTLIAGVRVSDDPTWVPDWMKPENQRVYYSTLIALEGFATT